MTPTQLTALIALGVIMIGITAAIYGLVAAWRAIRTENEIQKSLPARLAKNPPSRGRWDDYTQ